MQHGSLTSFLNVERSADDLWCEIEPEVSDCLAACAKHGSGTVIISDEPAMQVTRQ